VGEECELDEAMKIAIFRIIQESLNNILKHAHATHANIYLRYEKKNVRINVRDNGTGFDLERARQQRPSRPSLGLVGMQERAALLNGTVSIQSRPGYGTEVEAVIPYQRNGTDFHPWEEVKDDHTPTVGG
jgi:signal transduction histidine kinase